MYTLAASQASRPVSKDGEVNLGVVIRECIEEGRDRWWGWDGKALESRKRERREARRRKEMKMEERRERMKEGKKGVVLLRWGWRRPRE